MGSQTSMTSCHVDVLVRHRSRLAGPELHQSLLNFAKEFVSVLFMMFICALDENIRIGGLVGTQMCTNQLKHKHEAFNLIYFILVFLNITGRY